MERSLALAGAMLLATAASVTAQEVTLRYAHVGAEGDVQTRFATEVAELVEERSNGRIEIQLFPASQLGGVAELVDGIRSGAIDMGHHDFASLARIVPEVAVFNAPFVYRDAEHAARASDPAASAPVQEINERLVEEGGVRIVGRIYRGARHVSAKFPVLEPADLEGQPFRAVPLDLWVSMVKGFGAIPTPVDVAELPTALMTGVVVGQENPLTMINANALYEVQSDVSLTGHMHSVLAVFANEQTWQSVDEADRELIAQAMIDKGTESLQWALEEEERLIGVLEEKGITFHTPEDDLDLEAFKTSVLDQINRDFPEFGPYIDQISKIQ